MLLDDQNRYADSQVLGGPATIVSTDFIDHGALNNLGMGEPMAAMINTESIAKGSVADETYTVQFEVDNAAAFPSGALVGGVLAIPRLTPAGTIYGLPVPQTPGQWEQFSRLSWTTGGTAPALTYSAYLVPASVIKGHFHYPDAVEFGT